MISPFNEFILSEESIKFKLTKERENSKRFYLPIWSTTAWNCKPSTHQIFCTHKDRSNLSSSYSISLNSEQEVVLLRKLTARWRPNVINVCWIFQGKKKVKTEKTAIVFLNLNHDLRNKLISFSPIFVTNGLQNKPRYDFCLWKCFHRKLTVYLFY